MTAAPALRGSQTAYRSLQTFSVALVLVLAAGIFHVGSSPYIGFAFCGSFVVLASSRPSKKEVLVCVALGLGFALVYRLHHGVTADYFGSQIGIPGTFLGMGAVQLAVGRRIWASRPDQAAALTEMLQCALIPLLCIGSMIAVDLAALLTPVTYDGIVFAFDLHLDSASVSWKLGELFREHTWLFSLCGHVYNSLPLALSACLALQWRERKHRIPVNLGLVFLTLGAVGFALYQICPVSGPIYLFPQDFPTHLPALLNAAPARMAIAPRNGMPSLHVGWTFLLLWNLRKRWILAPLAAAFLTFTAMATLGSGEHYLADLIVAIPLALTIQAAFLETHNDWRRAALATGSLLTVAWLIAFRTGTVLSLPSGGVLWVVVGATVLLPLALVWQSERSGELT